MSDNHSDERIISDILNNEQIQFMERHGVSYNRLMKWYHEFDSEQDFQEAVEEAINHSEVESALGAMDDQIENLKQQIEHSKQVKIGLIQDQVLDN